MDPGHQDLNDIKTGLFVYQVLRTRRLSNENNFIFNHTTSFCGSISDNPFNSSEPKPCGSPALSQILISSTDLVQLFRNLIAAILCD